MNKIKTTNKVKTLVTVLSLSAMALAAVPIATKAATATSSDAVKNRPALGRHFQGQNSNLTDAEKTALKQKMETGRAAREAQKLVVDKAIEAGNYDAWLAAVGTNNPFLGKITKDNFSKLQELHQLENQIKTLKTSLGIEDFGRDGLGSGLQGRGIHSAGESNIGQQGSGQDAN